VLRVGARSAGGAFPGVLGERLLNEALAGIGEGAVVVLVIGALALDRLVARGLDLDLEEAGSGFTVVTGPHLEARTVALDVIVEAAQVPRVEVDTLVGEAAVTVDFERLIPIRQPLDEGLRAGRGDDVLGVHSAAQPRPLVQRFESYRRQSSNRALHACRVFVAHLWRMPPRAGLTRLRAAG
jgi:hypothetical protein